MTDYRDDTLSFDKYEVIGTNVYPVHGVPVSDIEYPCNCNQMGAITHEMGMTGCAYHASEPDAPTFYLTELRKGADRMRATAVAMSTRPFLRSPQDAEYLSYTNQVWATESAHGMPVDFTHPDRAPEGYATKYQEGWAYKVR